eukprot:FR741655.1.p2 GENE.FR741655.1~~FR741655.1.p2  ORF type:complete len:102 (+),score=0.96 FR741655.1:127-432(+)
MDSSWMFECESPEECPCRGPAVFECHEMHTVYENVKLAEMAIELKEQHVDAAPALGSGVNRPLVPVAVLFSRRTGSRQSWGPTTRYFQLRLRLACAPPLAP